MTVAGFSGTLIFFVFLRVLRGELLFLVIEVGLGAHPEPSSAHALCRAVNPKHPPHVGLRCTNPTYQLDLGKVHLKRERHLKAPGPS